MIFERSEAEKRGPTAIRKIEGPIAESEKCTEGAAGKCTKEKIEGDGPSRPTRFGGKRLDDGPPEEDGCREKAEVFNFVPGVRAEGEFERGRNMPGEERDGGENPAHNRICEKFPKGLHRRPTEERAESGAHEALRKSVEKRKRRHTEKKERRDHEHQEDVLDHVYGEGDFIEGGERRADGNPEREHGSEKSDETPR